MPLEIEVKFFIDDPDAVRNRLINLGAVGRGLNAETNLIFEDASDSLQKKGRLLRLRQSGGQIHLTVKAPPVSPDRQFKVHHELEVAVDNFDTMAQMLDLLGFHVERQYEKHRETFIWQPITFCLDEVPYGHFLEIEGPRPSILEAVEALKLNWTERIVHNYLEIFECIRQRRNLPFRDITFHNFRGLIADWADIINGLQANR